MSKYTAEEIVKLLHSVSKIEFIEKSNEIDTYFKGDDFPYSYRSFEFESFTRDLLELIEMHLVPGSFQRIPKDDS